MSDEAIRGAQQQFAQDKVGTWLLHVPTGTVGKVAAVYAPGEYGHPKPRYGPRPRVQEPVIEFEDGNSFLARPENFRVLSEGDQLTFAAATAGLKTLMAEIVEVASRGGAMFGSTPESLRVVLQAVLRNQLRALEPR